jgi:hypothetical protein
MSNTAEITCLSLSLILGYTELNLSVMYFKFIIIYIKMFWEVLLIILKDQDLLAA